MTIARALKDKSTDLALPPRPSRAMVAMSGGVDSSVAALLLKNAGWDVCGVTGKMYGSNVLGDAWEDSDAWLDEVDDAKRVCRRLGIAHYTFNCKEAFEHSVIERFVKAYLNGETPNPCVDCNLHVKFGVLQTRSAEAGCDYLATGHYARICHDTKSGRWKLLRATCLEKDQSYMLCHLTQEQLSHTLFPLGALTKDEVRALAHAAGFSNANKTESQDICFVPDGNYASFIERWCQHTSASRHEHAQSIAFQPGDIVNTDGRRLGQHRGLIHYTIGQRKGIGIAAAEPLYVIGKIPAENKLVVGGHAQLMTREVRAGSVNCIGKAPEDVANRNMRVLAKTSYRQKPTAAQAHFGEGAAAEVHMTFDEPIVRPAPGQTLALYDADTGQSVIAGAIIS